MPGVIEAGLRFFPPSKFIERFHCRTFCSLQAWRVGGDLLLLNQDAWIFYDDPEDLRT